MSLDLRNLGNGVEGLFVESERFKTTLVSFNFYMPLESDTVALNTLLPFILTSCSKDYPDFSALNLKLAELYGAQLDASAEKYGDFSLLKMTVSVIDDQFAPNGETIVKDACKMLLGMIFNPSVSDGAFSEYDLQREKRKAIEHIKSEYSDKRIYAKARLIEEMFKGNVYGLPKCGTVEQVEAITGKALYNAWENMLKSAFVRVHVIGKTLPDGLFDEIEAAFGKVERQNAASVKTSTNAAPADKAATVTENDNVTQGKLCLGFSTDIYGNDDDSLVITVLADIFGGGPYSRLFANVREKMSLCYYCRATAVRSKGLITVESGVETENAEKAEKEILNQLEAVKKGEFSDFEFGASIKSLCDSFETFADSEALLDNWYSVKANNQKVYTPEDLKEKLLLITKEDVIKAANGVKLHTVYKLLPKEEK